MSDMAIYQQLWVHIFAPILRARNPVNLVGKLEDLSGRLASLEYVLALSLQSDSDMHLWIVHADHRFLFPVEEVFVSKLLN